MRKPKIKFNQIRPTSKMAEVLISIGRHSNTSRVYTKDKRIISDNVKRLIKRNFIETGNKKKKFYLTEKGLIEFLKLELTQTDLLPSGKECMVVFDIPEVKKEIREALRIFLEDSCFIRLQKSVWISQFDAANLLAEIFCLIGLDKWIKVFIVEEKKGSKKPRPPLL
ncbi:MAG: CRISPR-associated endonuclease Cas2 [Candidatus Uhrbacteria bacterium]